MLDGEAKIGEEQRSEQEWDEIDTELMIALAEVEEDMCPGCGAFLSEELIPDHGHHIDTKICVRCDAMHRFNRTQSKIDERFKDGDVPPELGGTPSARRMFVTRIPLPGVIEPE